MKNILFLLTFLDSALLGQTLFPQIQDTDQPSRTMQESLALPAAEARLADSESTTGTLPGVSIAAREVQVLEMPTDTLYQAGHGHADERLNVTVGGYIEMERMSYWFSKANSLAK